MRLQNHINPLASKSWELYIMALPCFLLVIIFSYLPIAGWSMAFFNYKPGLSLFKSDFRGLYYFKLFFSDMEILPVLRNTLVMSFLGLVVSPLPIIFAIFLSEMKSDKYRRLLQTVTTLPNFISWILVFSIAFTFFSVGDGFINKILLSTGLIKEPFNILANNNAVWYFQTAIGLWKSLGFSAVIYLAAIAGIDMEQYYSAKIDGAGRIATMWHITVPGLIPTYITMLLIAIGNMLNNGFEQYYIFYNSMVHDHIQVLDYYVYRIGIASNDYSFSTAIGISKTFISIILVFTANFISKRLRGQSII